MPLDELQKRILRVLMPLRSKDSVFAGGSVLQRHAFRLSDDQDIFHESGTDIDAISTRDLTALHSAGFTFEIVQKYEGLITAIVGNDQEGQTKIQWVEAGTWNFFGPVPDRDMGWRLHMADLSVNKVLAAGGRKEVRDYVDLALIDRHIMPLWHAIWAAPGKDEQWSPISLAEKIAMTNSFRQDDFDLEILSMVPLSAGKIGGRIRQAIEKARDVFRVLPSATAGCMFVDKDGAIVNDPALISADTDVTPISAKKGGTWPSGPDIDHTIISGIVAVFGHDGSGAEQGPAKTKPPGTYPKRDPNMER